MNGIVSNTKSLNIKFSISNESLAQYALFMFLCSEVIKKIIDSFLNNVTISTYIMIFLIYVPVVMIILKGGFRAVDFFVLWLMVAIAFGASYLLYPENEYYFTRPMYGVLYRVLRLDRAIYAYLFIRLSNNKKHIFKTLVLSAYVLTIYYTITLLQTLKIGYWMEYNGKGILVERNYSLTYGYSVVLPMLIFVYMAIKEKKIIYYFMAVINFVCILLGGSRGSLICIAVFIILFILRSWRIWTKNYLFMFLCLLAIFMCVFFVFGGATLILEVLEKMNIQSRTIEKLLEGTIVDDNGRNYIWGIALDMIKESGIWGYGLFGDRPMISSFHYAGYCHNIFLEILVNFGPIFGWLLIGIIVIESIKMLFFCPDDEWRNLFLIFFACSCELILSMSFWYVSYFWFAMGIRNGYYKEKKVINNIRKRKKD